MIKPYNDEMIMLLKKAKKIINEAEENNIKLTFDVNISNDKPTCYKDILENKFEVEMVRKKVSDLQKKYKDELLKNTLKKTSEYVSKKTNGLYGDVCLFEVNNYDIDTLKKLTGDVLNKLNNGIVFAININDNSLNFICKLSNNIKDKINAGELVKNVSKIAEGNGGGSQTFAQGGGTNTDKLDMIKEYIKDQLIRG